MVVDKMMLNFPANNYSLRLLLWTFASIVSGSTVR